MGGEATPFRFTIDHVHHQKEVAISMPTKGHARRWWKEAAQMAPIKPAVSYPCEICTVPVAMLRSVTAILLTSCHASIAPVR